MNIFGIGLPEMVLIMIVALLVFGPKKLPEIGRSLGKALRGFQDASKEFQDEIKKEAQQIEEAVTMNAQLEGSQAKTIDPNNQETKASTSNTNTSQQV